LGVPRARKARGGRYGDASSDAAVRAALGSA